MSRLSGRIKRIENLEAKNALPDITFVTFYENRQGEAESGYAWRYLHPETKFSLDRAKGETEAEFRERFEQVKAEKIPPLSASRSKGKRK